MVCTCRATGAHHLNDLKTRLARVFFSPMAAPVVGIAPRFAAYIQSADGSLGGQMAYVPALNAFELFDQAATVAGSVLLS